MNAFKDQPKRLVTFETFDQIYEETWPDQQTDKDKHFLESCDVWDTALNTMRIWEFVEDIKMKLNFTVRERKTYFGLDLTGGQVSLLS